MSVLESHYKGYEDKVRDFVKECKFRKIESIKLIKEWPCLESYPCQGHKGVLVNFENGQNLEYPCTSVTAGILMYFCGVKTGHCLGYVNQSMRDKLDKLII